MIKQGLALIDRFLQRYLPDPFVIAVLLNAAVLAAAVLIPPDPARPMLDRATVAIQSWGNSFWGLAEFTLQMAMILIGGHVIATSSVVRIVLIRLIDQLRSPWQAVLFCTFAAMLASWINWGLGLVVGGFVALEVGRKFSNVSFRVLVASSYSGFLVWHGGLSGSIPLAINSEAGPLVDLIGRTISIDETIFSRLNILAVASMCVVLPITNLFCRQLAAGEDGLCCNPLCETNHDTIQSEPNEPGLNRIVLVPMVLVGLGVFYGWSIWREPRSARFDLNAINLILFLLGPLLHGSAANFIRAVATAAPKVAPILIQFPLYASIMGVMKDCGLAAQLSEWFVAHSNPQTLPLLTFYSAGLLNLLIPSGGGQWVVQGPIVIEAARSLDVEIPRVAMAVAWGDAWTNLAQPFWAVPLLSIAGLEVKDILSFCLIVLLTSGIVLSALFMWV
jgi:short-chain fatty acids transporter